MPETKASKTVAIFQFVDHAHLFSSQFGAVVAVCHGPGHDIGLRLPAGSLYGPIKRNQLAGQDEPVRADSRSLGIESLSLQLLQHLDSLLYR